MVTNLPANAGGIRHVSLIRGWKDPPEGGMAVYSSIPAWRISWTEAWWAIVHRCKELDTIEVT